MRRTWNCGWLSKFNWVGPGWPLPIEPFEFPTRAPDADEVCPGFLLHLPQVQEGVRAMRWDRRSSAKDYYDVPLTDLCRDAIDIADAGLNAVESAQLKATKNKHGKG